MLYEVITIEELAGVDIFCSDKTGTLTRNEMEVADPVVLEGFTVRDLFLHAALASRAENNDPIELPIFRYIEEQCSDADWQGFKQINFVPFDPIRKRTEAEIEGGGQHFHAVKGAPQVLMELVITSYSIHYTKLYESFATSRNDVPMSTGKDSTR